MSILNKPFLPTRIAEQAPKLPIIPSRLIALTDRLLPRYVINPEDTDITPYTSYFGTPVYSPLFLLDIPIAPGNQNNAINPGNVLVQIDKCLITVTGTKNIVKTSIQGRSGTIKEYISNGDFMIEVSGSIVSQFRNVYPQEDVNNLITWLSRAQTVSAVSDFLSKFALYDFVVESDWKVMELEGSRNEQPFSFKMSSDTPENIILVNNYVAPNNAPL